MTILHFPPPETASPDGVLAFGGDLEPASLILAYSQGIFPWPHKGYPLLWFCPPKRAILQFSDLHIPRRLARALKKNRFTFSIDENFEAVIRHCSRGSTRKEKGTWINAEIIDAYTEMFRLGYAHSFEAYREGKLVGGLYGIGLGGMFGAESMFYLESGASKAALLFAVEFLKSCGASWMDVQMPSPLLTSLGAKEIERDVFLKKLGGVLGLPALFEV